MVNKIKWFIINSLLSLDEKYMIIKAVESKMPDLHLKKALSYVLNKEEIQEDIDTYNLIKKQLGKKYFNFHFYKPSIQYYFIK